MRKNPMQLTRREWLSGTASVAVGGQMTFAWGAEQAATKPKTVAAVITAYHKFFHADVVLGKILEGWKYDGGPKPALKLASMYVDQFPEGDMARMMSKKHGVPIFDSIEQALTLGGNSIAVDGVISIGEHGNYPVNERGQQLYPRRRFFEGITNTLEKYGQVVPVFNDKHLGPVWEDALWMYERARQLKVPFMAGSSMPVGYRQPETTIPLDSEIESMVGIGYSGLDVYGFHALDFFQSFAERRRGAEKGVAWVQCLSGDEIWKKFDDGTLSIKSLEAAIGAIPYTLAKVREIKDLSLFLFQYIDGLMGGVLMAPSADYAATAVSIKLKGRDNQIAIRFDERTEPHFPHFAYLLKGIERMIHTGTPSYPVERTLLSGGVLDRALISHAQKGAKLATPELAIAYRPVDYPFPPHVDLEAAPPTG